MVGTRGTTPHEENPAAPDEERGTINFKAVWSGFKAAGSTSKPPPRGIGTLWKYILPGRDANGAEGVDYLLGEQAVVNNAVQQRASAAPPVGAAAEDSPALPTKDTGAAAGASAASATEDPPASDDLFPAASTSDHEPEEGTPSPRPTRQTTSPKQTKSTKATNQPKLTKATKQPKPSKVSSAKPPKPTKKPTRKASASKPRTSSARSSPAVSPRPLCHRRLGQVFPRPSQSSPPKRSSTDGSSVDRSPPRSDSHKESDEAAHPVAASRKGTDAQSAEAPTEAQQNVRAAAQPLYDICSDNGDDINTDPIGNNNYDVLDSGDESEEEDLSELNVSDSESSASDCIDEDDEELFAKEERHFADKFLESLGGQEKVLAGELIGPALKDLSTTGWDDPETPDVAAYLETPFSTW
ncbi:hypothetical protein PR002_g18585 [Phytophthora rubi]|uniref:Uncharacterized protein n=1 Tax=Phytophthora rubi TaxID=129364 RepID=A0A6A3JVP8_9STRA|nr:hypothetical protein PR002_g18585 [Phytophthora rubi]